MLTRCVAGLAGRPRVGRPGGLGCRVAGRQDGLGAHRRAGAPPGPLWEGSAALLDCGRREGVPGQKWGRPELPCSNAIRLDLSYTV